MQTPSAGLARAHITDTMSGLINIGRAPQLPYQTLSERLVSISSLID